MMNSAQQQTLATLFFPKRLNFIGAEKFPEDNPAVNSCDG